MKALTYPIIIVVVIILLLVFISSTSSGDSKNSLTSIIDSIKQNLTFTTKQQTESPVKLQLTTDKYKLKKGEKAVIKVKASGVDSSKITVLDLKLIYDKAVVKPTFSVLGKFFKKSIELVMDNTTASYMSAIDPRIKDDQDAINPKESVLEITFTALSKGVTQISLSPDSVVYIAKTGSLEPELSSVSIEVE